MSVTVLRICLHSEVIPGSVAPMPHQFRSEPQPSPTGQLLVVDGEGVLLEGDRFQSAARPDHSSPRAGTFVRPPSGTGEFASGGQSLLKIRGVNVMTMRGSVSTCCEVQPEVACRAAVIVGGKVLLRVDDSPVLTGR